MLEVGQLWLPAHGKQVFKVLEVGPEGDFVLEITRQDGVVSKVKYGAYQEKDLRDRCRLA
jgi:hypothetical protein